MTAQDKRLLLILLGVVFAVIAVTFAVISLTSRKTPGTEKGQPAFQNPFESSITNPFSEQGSFENPFSTDTGGEYQNPFENLR